MNIDRTIAGSEHKLDEAGFDADAARGKPRKAPNAFRTISEVADDLHIPQHVLRFWETKFPLIKPLKRGGGRRYYRPDDILLLRRISDLLYIQGYTIKGVQRLLREGGGKLSDEIPPPAQDELSESETVETHEAQLTMPGLALVAPAGSARPAAKLASRDGVRLVAAPAAEGPDTAAQCARLRALLAAVLAELEAVRALLP
jgi:DNA-binding transcriptional MerR regulator